MARTVAARQDQAIDLRAQPGDSIRFVATRQGLWRIEQGHLDARTFQLARTQGWEARVAKSRCSCVLRRVLGQRTARFKAADTTAQLSILRQGDKGGGRLVEVGKVRDRGVSVPNCVPMALRAIVSKVFPSVSVGMSGGSGSGFKKANAP